MRRAAALAILLAASAARADVAPAELARVGVRTPPGAAAPMNARFAAAAGSETLAQAAGGEPLVLVFADYGCTALCGPALVVTAARLRETELKPGRDYRLAVAGLDPASTPAQAQAFGAARLGSGSPLLAASALLVGPATSPLAHALGYGYAFDPAAHQYVHPVAAFVLAPNGRVTASLSEINVTAPRLRAAVAAAARGEATGWTDQLALVCHQALVAVGRFDGPAIGAMRAGAVAVLLAMAGGFWLLARGAAEGRGVSGSVFLLPAASTGARATDGVFWLLMSVSAVVIVLVGALVAVFAIRYRRGSKAGRGPLPEIISSEFEIGWTAATVFLFLFLFWWAASARVADLTPPKDAMEVHVVGKQWMWKLQHPSGAREINALHVPVGVPVKLVMTSQDTIHDFYVPAFRMKQDVLPGRYTQEWFKATQTGVFPIECAEYCGTDHSKMGGQVFVMSPADYARWSAAQPNSDDLANQGARLYADLGCGACHGGARQGATGGAQGPSLVGLYGATVRLADGRFIRMDEQALHDSLIDPARYPLAGWPAAMPSYAKAVDEEGLVKLVAYLKSLGAKPGDRT